MKLSAITNEEKIKAALALLHKNLSRYSDEVVFINYSSPGGMIPIQVQFSIPNEFWWTSVIEKDKNKYWNPVGFGYPTMSSVEDSDCEFNCSMKGYNKAAGLFAKDHKDNIFLLHSGKAGGKTPGTSIENFCDFCSGVKRHQVSVGGIIREFFLVSDINSKNLFENIIIYANAIYDFKAYLKAKIK